MRDRFPSLSAARFALLVAVAAALPAPAAAAALPDRPFFDVRQQAISRLQPAAPPRRADVRLQRSLGRAGVLSIDSLSGAPRSVGRLDGFLTEASAAPATQVALDYVRAHRDVFRLDERDLAGLRLTRHYTSIDGTQHLVWAQTYRGIPAFDNDLRAHVARGGRLITIGGSPLPNLAVKTTEPRLSAAAALAVALLDAGSMAAVTGERATGDARRTTRFDRGQEARLTLFHGLTGTRLAWRVEARADSTHFYDDVVDAASGAVLFRQNLVKSATGRAWDYFPNAEAFTGFSGGAQQTHDFTAPGWLPGGAGSLSGNNAHVYVDADDDNAADPGDEIPPNGANWNYPFSDHTAVAANPNCVDADHNPATTPTTTAPETGILCSWDSGLAHSWDQQEVDGNNHKYDPNLFQNGTQVFYFVNRYHDHLAAPPIGFTDAAGNFQAVNATGAGRGGDPIDAEIDNGANVDAGLPDVVHVNDSNFNETPDGTPGQMQLYLWTSLGELDPTADINAGDDAAVVYHEYTHGMNGRLIADSDGASALGPPQSSAMDEAWADWYAMDFLVASGFDQDTSNVGDLVAGFYTTAGVGVRSEGIDCPVAGGQFCPGSDGAGPGGYTYGDFGKVIADGVESHADGEIWAQTLWQLRQTLGAAKTEQLVTRAHELSPVDPSFLDQRNAILQADQVDFAGADQGTIWQVFGQRGMGFFAASLSGADTQPTEDFQEGPPSTPPGTIAGRVTDQDTGAPVPRATVAIAGHDSGLPVTDLAGATDADGRYAIASVPGGSYPFLYGIAPGYDPAVKAGVGVVSAATTNIDWQLRRDWAAVAGGAKITDATPPDLSVAGCGASGAVDGDLANGWGSYAPDFGGDADLPAAPLGPRSVTVQLPGTVDVASFAVDPGATCGDDESSSVGQYKIETSADGTTFTPAASGVFTRADDHRLNAVTPTGGAAGVRFVRFTMIAPQGPKAAEDATYRQFMDVSEVEVYGKATPAPTTTTTVPSLGRDLKAPAIRLRLTRQRLRRALRSGLVVTIQSDEAASVTARLALARRAARRYRLRAGSAVARGSARFTKPASRKVRLRFSRQARRRLARARRLSFALSVSARDLAGNADTTRQAVVLRR